MRSWKSSAAILVATTWLVLVALASSASAADTIVAGSLGGQAPLWPFYVAMQKGIFADEGITLDLNFAPSGASVVQQLTAGSIEAVVSVGLTEPLEAIDKGAPIAIIRIIGRSAPYVLIAKPTIKSIKDLRGKTISIGPLPDIITIYFERMMAANGLKKGDYDVISAGVAAARFAALRAGAADAAMVLPPLNFHAAEQDYPTIGLAADYVKDLPFTGMVVYKTWAASHRALVQRLLDATTKSIAWLDDPAHRQEAIDLLVKSAHARPKDAAASYDFLRRIGYFEPTGKVSRKLLGNMIAADQKRGNVGAALTVDRVTMPGLTPLTD
ncbi:MAG TPA: ABC transporter substrate-binding protein [Stellaceae bacterium]|nr:ABC transporter substrate-binding protein [Stellaceae bacterium]